MPANFVFRNASDTGFVTAQDLGAIATSVSIAPVQFIVRNAGDAVASTCKVRIVADESFLNTSGTPLLSVLTSSTLNPTPGTYALNFLSNTSVMVDSNSPVTVVSDGVTVNTNVISGLRVILNSGTLSGTSATVSVSDGYTRVNISGSLVGSSPTEINFAHIYCQSMTAIAGALINGGSLGQTTYYYVVTAVTEIGESLVSNRTTVINASPGKSAQITWSIFPGALSYNVYKSPTSGDERLIVNVSGTTFVDDGTLSVNNSIPYPVFSDIHSQHFWINVLAPTGTTTNTNPRKFKLRAIGISS
jgi:hypothetical protein